MVSVAVPLKIHAVLEKVTVMELLMGAKMMETGDAKGTSCAEAITARNLVFIIMKKMIAVIILQHQYDLLLVSTQDYPSNLLQVANSLKRQEYQILITQS